MQLGILAVPGSVAVDPASFVALMRALSPPVPIGLGVVVLYPNLLLYVSPFAPSALSLNVVLFLQPIILAV